jgi:phospholipase C
MKRAVGVLWIPLLFLQLVPVYASITRFSHIVVIIQENRTPDNLFQGLCAKASACGVPPKANQYNIQTGNWLNKDSQSGVTQPAPAELAESTFDPGHDHESFHRMCDLVAGACKMDGGAEEGCSGSCPPNFAFTYVSNASGILNPYLALATQYGWANFMFQTNQGPSYPAHQFLFGATSAPSATDDKEGTFAAENGDGGMNGIGCASNGTKVQLITADGQEQAQNRVFSCFEHGTLSDIVAQAGFSWRYYAPTQNYIWTAPNSINHICDPQNHTCTGSEWVNNVDLHPKDVLTDIAGCKLQNLSWVVPSGQESDHPEMNKGKGPSWVASIVNAIGNSGCVDGPTSYWNDTAILITWDDWGGWYDHVPPKILAYPQGGYQYGFRVPFIFVSAYTPPGFISSYHQDFGTIARFIETNFGIQEGSLGFADARADTNLSKFYDLGRKPRTFDTIPAPLDARYFINDTSPLLPPDND